MMKKHKAAVDIMFVQIQTTPSGNNYYYGDFILTTCSSSPKRNNHSRKETWTIGDIEKGLKIWYTFLGI